MTNERILMAIELFQQAYRRQMEGELDSAVVLYKQSLEIQPSAEAYTFLGWTYRFLGKLQDAIAECKKAIEVDPSLGNPYNDIGSYLLELGQAREAIPWLRKAIRSERYDSYHQAWYNLGRAYVQLELYRKADSCFAKAAEIEPDYLLAVEASIRARRRVN